MPTYRDYYLADSRARTLRLMTAADLEDAERMVSSSRRMVGAASGEFERLKQSGYRVTNPPSADEIKASIVRFIGGLRGERENAVGIAQIKKHFNWVDVDDLNSYINQLLGEDRISIARSGLRTGHNWRQGYVYEVKRNPTAGVMHTDRDGLKIIKDLASDSGQGTLVKVFHGVGRAEVGRQAAVIEQRKGVELDVIHLTDDGSYGYAPAGLVEASLTRMDALREERSRKDWADFEKRVQANKDKVAKRMEALEKKYGPKMADLQDRFEDAVNTYLDEPTPQAKRDLAPVVATAKRYDRTLGGAVAVFMAELTKMPEEAGGKRRNPHSNGPDFARMAWNFVPGSALIEEELRMMDRQRRQGTGHGRRR